MEQDDENKVEVIELRNSERLTNIRNTLIGEHFFQLLFSPKQAGIGYMNLHFFILSSYHIII